jgi:hypothetical protein
MARSYANYEERRYETDEYESTDDPNVIPYETKEITKKYIVTPKTSREGFPQSSRRNKQVKLTKAKLRIQYQKYFLISDKSSQQFVYNEPLSQHSSYLD